MKTRNKLLLSATAMLALSMGAMITGTVAWFTATRQITINLSNVKVVSTEGDLNVTLVGEPYTVDDSTPGILSLTGTDIVTDVSGDGINMYKPIFLNSTTAVSINEVTSATDNYVEFQLTIARSDGENTNGFEVYLGSNSAIEPLDALEPADVVAAASARVAILDETKATRKVLWAPEAGDASYLYLGEGTGPTYGVDGFDKLDAEEETDFVAGDFINYAIDSDYVLTLGNSPLISDLSSESEEVITVRMWIEGEDLDHNNDAKDGFFTLTLDLYALPVAP